MGLSGAYGRIDDDESVRVIDTYLDVGGTLLDTGDFYAAGHNEQLIARALRTRNRTDVVLSVKFGALLAPGGGMTGIDARPAAVRNSLTYSLQRLGTDHVDIYRPARLDRAVPIEDTVGTIAELVDQGAEQLEIADPSCVKSYAERQATQWEHTAEIRREFGYRDFADAASEVDEFLAARAWTRVETSKALFDATVTWLRRNRILLPGASVLARLVAGHRDRATEQIHTSLHQAALDADSRNSELERLRRGPTRVSGRSMTEALHRVSELAGLGAGAADVSTAPANRLEALARDGLSSLDMTSVWAAIEEVVPRYRLAAAVETIEELAPTDADDDAAWRAELVSRWAVVRPYLPLLAEAIDAAAHLDEQAAALDAAWRSLGARISTTRGDGRVRVEPGRDGRAQIRVDALEKLEEPPSLLALRDLTEQMMPQVDLPELLLEVHARTGYLSEFAHASGGESHMDDAELSLAAVLVAEATNVGYKPVAKPRHRALNRPRLSHVEQNYVRAKTLRAANARLIEAQADLPLAQIWGGGMVASVDGLRFVVPVNTVYAAHNPRYFGRRRGATWLNAINDQVAGIGATVATKGR